MQNYQNLEVWKKAHSLTLDVYKTTTKLPKEEVYGLCSQARRASASIPTNIAEGCGREGDTEFGRFLTISLGSANELEYQLLLMHDLKFIGEQEWQNLNNSLNEVKRKLFALLKKVKT